MVFEQLMALTVILIHIIVLIPITGEIPLVLILVNLMIVLVSTNDPTVWVVATIAVISALHPTLPIPTSVVPTKPEPVATVPVAYDVVNNTAAPLPAVAVTTT